MIKGLLAVSALVLATCGSAQPANSGPDRNQTNEAPMESGLVALEFNGSRRSLDRLAPEAVRLGWRIDTRTDRSLRLLPPPDYDPDRFGLLLARIEALGIGDVGLRLIGPNGPVGPEG